MAIIIIRIIVTGADIIIVTAVSQIIIILIIMDIAEIIIMELVMDGEQETVVTEILEALEILPADKHRIIMGIKTRTQIIKWDAAAQQVIIT
jgi:hypothetical protein